MYRSLVIMISAVLIAGCGHLENSDVLSRAGEALGKIGEGPATVHSAQGIEALFAQPYIDPLTEYLHRYENDPAHADQLEEVRKERERRCQDVARRYNTDEITEAGLALYRRGYGFSCPEDVAAYEARLEAMGGGDTESAQQTPASAQQSVQSAGNAQNAITSSQLNECYLLTRIRNFSAALEACRGPAENGAVGAQANMARIYSALGQHELAHRWARQAAPESRHAAHLLGEMYAQGLGVKQDRSTAVKWFGIAAELGHAGAQDALDKLNPAAEHANAN